MAETTGKRWVVVAHKGFKTRGPFIFDDRETGWAAYKKLYARLGRHNWDVFILLERIAND